MAAKDQTEALVTWIQVKGEANQHSRMILVKGLDPEAMYRIEGTEQIFGGDTLMYAGMLVERLWGDFTGKLIHLVKVWYRRKNDNFKVEKRMENERNGSGRLLKCGSSRKRIS